MDKSKGLGDTIDKITTKTGVKKIIRVVTNVVGIGGCGCAERKDKLNEIFPYDKTK